MLAERNPPKEAPLLLAVLASTPGVVVAVLGAGLVIAGLVWWARVPGRPERQLTLGASVVLTVMLGAIYWIAVAAGWWTGEYFTLPALSQAALLVCVGLLGCTLWLAGYGWLAEHTPRPMWAYLGVSGLLVVAVALGHVFNIGRGKILVGPEWTIVYEAVAGLLILWMPVLLYEALRRALQSSDLPP